MKRLKIKLFGRKRLGLILFVSALIAISWDLATSKQEAEEGTFRYESEFDAVSGATTKVGIVTSDYHELKNPVGRNINPDYTQIEDMVGKAIELQGGLEWVIDKGDKVMIKVNLVGANSPSGQGENTDVRVVKALIKHIADYTENDVEIIVAEGTARSNDDPSDSKSVWGNSGYRSLLSDTDLSGINLRLLNLNQTIDDLIEIDLGSEGTSAKQGSKYYVHREEVEADVYIAVPVLKIHNTGITNALKLQIGSAPGCYYGYNKASGTSRCPSGIYHDVGQRIWTTEAIVDLSNIADIDFVVVDAIMCLELQKTNKVSNQVRFNTIFAGADPVAVDHVGAKLMGVNPDDVAHITLAEKVGLGTNDPEKITVLGVPIEQAMKRVKKSQSEDGRFGQSNRTWVLSQAFSGTDISQEFFADEANIKPTPGQNGWSEPVYFFDDRIDLYSYYTGQTNIVTYAFSYFNAPKDQEAELWLGTHEAMVVYINGDEVYKFTSTASYSDDDRGEYKATINIKEGENSLLVKTLNKFGDYTFALNICEVEKNAYYFGNRVDGLKFYTAKSDTSSQSSGATILENKNTLSLKCYPNPVREYASISFNIYEADNTTIGIYDVSGRFVKTVCRKKINRGKHTIYWDLSDDSGNPVASGNYLILIQSGNEKCSVKLVVE
ncbi:MAG: DUF362 domain-containing protein [Prolixibacteraceae bacterium]|nr:DUF362 domain-containing protein [Prolixibacteraceae bacterium]